MLSNCGAGEDSGVLWTARRLNQSTLKEINLEYSLEDWCWSSNSLATWYEEPAHWKKPWCWKRLKAGGEGGDRDVDGIIDTMDISLSKLWETVKGREASHAAVHGVTKNQTWHSGWIATTSLLRFSTYPLPPLYTWDKTYHTGLSWEFHDLIFLRIKWYNTHSMEQVWIPALSSPSRLLSHIITSRTFSCSSLSSFHQHLKGRLKLVKRWWPH